MTGWSIAGVLLGNGAMAAAVSAGLFSLLKWRFESRFTAEIEASKIANAERLKRMEVEIAEADRKSALALRRDDSRMKTLILLNRLAMDGEALAERATSNTYGGEPLYPTRPYTGLKNPEELAALESDAYFFSQALGQAVTRLRECRDEVSWVGTEHHAPDEPFADDDSLIVKLRKTAADVRDEVQKLLTTWDH